MGACTRLVDIGEADAHRHRRRLCGVEGDPAAGALARRRMAARAVGGAAATLGRAFGDLIAAPGAADLEGLIEHRDEVERIIALAPIGGRSEEKTAELQSLMRNPIAGFCLKK